jgi:hypothetical protein
VPLDVIVCSPNKYFFLPKIRFFPYGEYFLIVGDFSSRDSRTSWSLTTSGMLERAKKGEERWYFLVHLRFFNPSKHECFVSMKMYLKYLILAETGLGNRPSSSPCFLSTESFFSRIFPLHTANEKIWRQERIKDQLDPLLFRAFPKCLHNSVSIAY